MRDIRYINIGIVFVIIVILNFVFSEICYTFRNCPDLCAVLKNQCTFCMNCGCNYGLSFFNNQSIILIVTVIVGLLASPGFGYLISSLVNFIWNLCGGILIF